MSNILIAMLLSHFIGDFYLQTEQSVKKKYKHYWWTLLHGVLYTIPGIIIFLLYATKDFTVYYLVFACSHLAYDSLKFLAMNKQKKSDQQKQEEILMIDRVFFLDQFAHLLTIIIICIVYLNKHGDISVMPKVIGYVNMDANMFDKLMKASLLAIIVIQPVSITFGKLFNIKKLSSLKLKEGSDKETIEGAGTVIGFLERIVILVLLLLQEYAAIGLVIAAKSIARFNGDVKAEFYIIGTFYGVISTIIPFILIWKL